MKKKFLNIFYWGVFATLLAIAGIVLLSSLNNNFPLKFLTVSSGSMEPSILPGSIVIVSENGNYKVNDVITYANGENNRQLITHRITGVEYPEQGSEAYITKGDANEDKDSEKVQKENVIGRVILSVPFVGYLVSFTKTTFGLILLIIIPGVLYVANELSVIKKEIEKIFKKQKRLNLRGVQK